MVFFIWLVDDSGRPISYNLINLITDGNGVQEPISDAVYKQTHRLIQVSLNLEVDLFTSEASPLLTC